MSELILAGEHEEPKVERINHVQTIDGGQFVRATVELPDELIPLGEVLAIANVDYVDDSPHTIRLRAHPKHYGHSDKRNVKHRSWKLTEHAFLLKDFLSSFEQISFEQAQAKRAEEQREALARINEMQADIQDAQTNPARMAQIVADGLAERRKERGEAEPTTLPAVTDGLPPLTLGTALQRGVTETNVALLRSQADHHLDVASVRSQWLKTATEKLSAAFAAMAPYYTEQVEVPMARVKGMQEQVKKISEGLKSLDLYLGKEVFVHRVASGESAPEEQPLTIVQRKLVMAEEMAVYVDVDESTDFNSISRFLKLLGEEPALADQIFPAPRAVVCMAATRNSVNYKDTSPLESALLNLENKTVFLLARDGENIFYLSSPVESHLGMARLFPTKDETDKIFRGIDGSEITFESLRYTSALSDHETHALHYKRLLILLCGLDHREKLFGEFYPGEQSLAFVSMAFQTRFLRFVADDDGAGLLAGGNRPMPVLEWLRRSNRYLTSGSRVFGVWKDIVSNERACPGGVALGASYEGESGVLVAFKGDKGPAVELEVTTSRNAARKVKAYPRRYYRGEDIFDSSLPIPYLVLDSVEPEQLQHYIQDRASRIENVDYLRLFKRALAWLHKEREAERPTRERLLDSIVSNGVCPAETAVATLNQAIRLWRSACRGKALPTLAEEGSSDWNEILDVVYLVAHAGETQFERVRAFLAAAGHVPVRLCVTGRARLVVYVEPKAEERDDRLTPHVWLHRIVLRLGKRVITEQSRTWERLPTFDPTEHQVASFGDESYWLSTFSGFADPEQKVELFNACEQGLALVRELSTDEQRLREFAEQYFRERRQAKGLKGKVPQVGLAMPIGLVHHKLGSRESVRAICLADTQASDSIYSLLEDGSYKQDFLQRELSKYGRPDLNVTRLRAVADRRLIGMTLKLRLTTKQFALQVATQPFVSPLGPDSWGNSYRTPSLDAQVAEGKAKDSFSEAYWFAGDLNPEDPTKGIDALLGNAGRLEGLQPGQLWLYSPEKDSSAVTEYFAEFEGLSASTYGATEYESQLLASWLTEAEREKVFQALSENYPNLLDTEHVGAGALQISRAKQVLALPAGTVVVEAFRPDTD